MNPSDRSDPVGQTSVGARGEAAKAFPFIVGCPRSGTTLLRAMLDSHPDMAIPGESYFVAELGRKRRVYDSSSGFALDELITDLFADRWFRRWSLPEAAVRTVLMTPRVEDYSEAIRCLYGLYARERGKSRFGDKTPSNVRRLRLLSRLFPEARFVHIIRDGRDVAVSLLQADLGPRNVSEAALTWKRFIRSGRAIGRSLGAQRYREIRYEQLVDDPEKTLRRLCPFLELEFDDRMLRYFQRSDEIVAPFFRPEIHTRLSLPPSKEIRQWRMEMARQDVDLFESLAGDMLAELGYGRSSNGRGMKLWVRGRRDLLNADFRRAVDHLANLRTVVLKTRAPRQGG